MSNKHEIPPLSGTVNLSFWNLGTKLLQISYDTDSVYLFSHGTAVFEFTSNSHVLDIRNQDNPRLIGYIRTPKGRGFGKALEFKSAQHISATGVPVCTILYTKPHVEMFLRFEEAICKMLTLYDDTDMLIDHEDQKFNAFINCNWKQLEQLYPQHKDLTITFN